jgi:hypothetical protein
MRLERPNIDFALFIVLLGAGCALVTQPLVEPLASTPPRADPAGLERDVRKLAVELHPRSVDPRMISCHRRFLIGTRCAQLTRESDSVVGALLRVNRASVRCRT